MADDVGKTHPAWDSDQGQAEPDDDAIDVGYSFEDFKSDAEAAKAGLADVQGAVEEFESLTGIDVPIFGKPKIPKGAAPGSRWACMVWNDDRKKLLGGRQIGPIEKIGTVQVAMVLLGPEDIWGTIRIAEYPSWIPLQEAPCPMHSVTLELERAWKQLGITEDDVSRIERADPMLGVAPFGTPFTQLNAVQQRAYLANAFAINAFKNRENTSLWLQTATALRKREEELGFCTMGKDPECRSQADTIDGLRKFTTTGRPVRIASPDLLEAFKRLQTAARGLPEEALSMAGTLTNGGQQATWNSCLTKPTNELAACLDSFAGEQGVLELVDVVQNPWKASYDASKAGPIEMVMGLDKKNYLVVKLGAMEPFALSLRMAITLGVGWSGIVLIGGGAGAYWLLKTKGGKAFRKRLIG